MVDENILFRYKLTDAWCTQLSKVTVFKNGKVRYKDGERKTRCCKLDALSLKGIEDIINRHSVIFEDTSFEIESPSVMDGVMNFFDFATQEGNSVHLMASNIGEVRNPNAHFSEGLFSPIKNHTANHDIIPAKAITVVKAFDEISEILVRSGVNSNCLRLTYQ